MLERLLGSSGNAGTNPEDIVLSLLPPDGLVPPRYRQVCDQLREWGLPEELAQLGV